MIRVFLILLTCFISLAGSSQSYLGKSKEEVKEIAFDIYDEVEVISETATSFKLKCDSEINEFIIADNVCVKFSSTKSYKCNCLPTVIKAYDENLESKGNMTWVSKDNLRYYQITLADNDYTVSIINNSSDLAVLATK